MRCYCFLRNVSDIMHYDTTPYFARFCAPSSGHKLPFGAEAGYLKFDRDTNAIRDQPFSEKAHKGFFLCYDIRPSGLWPGDWYVIDLEAMHYVPNALHSHQTCSSA